MANYQRLLHDQMTYYRQRASEYDTDWPDAEIIRHADIRQALSTYGPFEEALEIACGSGNWTRELRDLAKHVVALDASPEMLSINRQKLGDAANVRYVQADFFSWTPDNQYDLVFFSHWLSHIPTPFFEEYWERVSACLRPTGRVFLVDELPGEIWQEQFVNEKEQIARRQLSDGSEHQIVKVFWEPEQLTQALRNIGWELSVTPVEPLYWATGLRRNDDLSSQS